MPRTSKGAARRAAKRTHPELPPILAAITDAAGGAWHFPREERFRALFAMLGDDEMATLLKAGLKDHVGLGEPSDEEAMALVHCVMCARMLTHGDENGRFRATDTEIGDWCGRIGLLAALEMQRRLGIFPDLILPEDPFTQDEMYTGLPNEDAVAALQQAFEVARGPLN